jgi:hypothetical protein
MNVDFSNFIRMDNCFMLVCVFSMQVFLRATLLYSNFELKYFNSCFTYITAFLFLINFLIALIKKILFILCNILCKNCSNSYKSKYSKIK